MEDTKKENKEEKPAQVDNTDTQEQTEKKEEDHGIAGGRNGIRNIGNTCYMNTGLQVWKRFGMFIL